jgi:hypothetical protein
VGTLVAETIKEKRAKRAARVEGLRQEEIADSIAKYSYFKLLVESNPELQGYFEDLKKIIKASPTGTITQDEVNDATRGYNYFTTYDSDQQKSKIAQALDLQNNTNLYQESVDAKKTAIVYTARQKGLTLSEDVLNEMATLSRYNDWSDVELDNAIGAETIRFISGGGQAGGDAGTIQTQLLQWVNKNGLSLNSAQVARYVESSAFGGTDLESIKQNIRNTYMTGSYPAWSDRIAAGADPSDIAAPYKQRMASLLEIDPDSIDFNDVMLSKGMQGVSADGKAGIVPLYEFDKMIRKDPRWDRTENALKTYTDAGSSILQMFGLR